MARTARRTQPDSAASTVPISVSGSVDIRALKDFALAQLPEDHLLRSVLLVERDFLTPLELIAKMEVWVVLLNQRVGVRREHREVR